MKIDEDLLSMSEDELQKEVMKLRTAFRNELNDTGNRRCWITLLKTLPEGKEIEPLDLPEKTFLRNCRRYFRRNQ
jgi:hypothetical protein